MSLLNDARQHYSSCDSARASAAALIAIGHALTPDPRVAELQAEATAARIELARSDAKAGIALAFAGTGFTVLVAIGTLAHQSGPARVGLWLATTVLAAACSVLLWVIKPYIPRRGGTGFVAHAAASGPTEILSTLDVGERHHRLAAEVHRLSGIAARKYRRIDWGLYLMQASLVIIVMTLLLKG
ncbi:Pycsar system effector family protein [Streptosporangium saharense]|uniref:Multidrug efflux pump subunit AcrA (Membrane-fusion protein) n=1 Tax=Streptosporangium saharense TaxID=1706840 RepID=A0A7W7QWQ9_9ACTN|nr:Pycsar system effector family protein [Streptosporangium saharense]MBB4920948.1 multidrug efflux pump subunit AcrA (membrane-fusion protein) [Streptosporangium saharense]